MIEVPVAHTIAAATPNDSSHFWYPTAADVTATVRISVTSLFDPGIGDASDDTFDILATAGRVYQPPVLCDS